eukprot:m51a1_g3342 hypothetical protein (396) ;mRNA; f:398416-399733
MWTAAQEPLALDRRTRGGPAPFPPDLLRALEGEQLPLPARPPWTYDTTSADLQQSESAVFERWRAALERVPPGVLGHYESDPEVWRQLWRVCERSDLVAFVLDARNPLLHYSAALRDLAACAGPGGASERKRPVVVVLGKADLTLPEVLARWEALLRAMPGVDCVASVSAADMWDDRHKGLMASGLCEVFLRVSRGFYGEALEALPQRYSSAEEYLAAQGAPESSAPRRRPVVVGLVGNPNVGKSSLINALARKKVVSVNRNPGRTKHFQTIAVCDGILLCDSPGIVLPVPNIPQQIQVLFGLCPLSQIKDPFPALRYLGELVGIDQVYHLDKYRKKGSKPWSPYSLAEALAKDRCYNCRGGRLDVLRAARDILYDYCDGRIRLFWDPPCETGKQ